MQKQYFLILLMAAVLSMSSALAAEKVASKSLFHPPQTEAEKGQEPSTINKHLEQEAIGLKLFQDTYADRIYKILAYIYESTKDDHERFLSLKAEHGKSVECHFVDNQQVWCEVLPQSKRPYLTSLPEKENAVFNAAGFSIDEDDNIRSYTPLPDKLPKIKFSEDAIADVKTHGFILHTEEDFSEKNKVSDVLHDLASNLLDVLYKNYDARIDHIEIYAPLTPEQNIVKKNFKSIISGSGGDR